MSKRRPAPPPLTCEILSHRRGFELFVLEHADQPENGCTVCDP